MRLALRERSVYTAFTSRAVLSHFLLPTAVWQVSHVWGEGVVD
jgi:hypothetical protein